MTGNDKTAKIELRGVRVHNLKNVDLDLPLGRLIVITGVSGSGKSSLAFDTLYAEGQRRYVESFSTYSRRFLERFEKPDADRIEPIPPAAAVRQRSSGRSRRATVGTATEINDYLRILFARVGSIECPKCQRRVVRHTPASAAAVLAALEPRTRFTVCFPAAHADTDFDNAALARELSEAGFTRLIAAGRTVAVTADSFLPRSQAPPGNATGRSSASIGSNVEDFLVVVDRLTVGASSHERLADSLELAFRHGSGTCVALVEARLDETAPGLQSSFAGRMVVDGVEQSVLSFHERLVCSGCRTEFADPEPALFNFNSPLGACPRCRGTGAVPAETAEEHERPRAADAPPQPAPQAKSAAAEMLVCPACQGGRLRDEALAVRIDGESIVELTRQTTAELADFFYDWKGELAEQDRKLADHILAQVEARLAYLRQAGLEYLTLDRPARTLSAGEARRVRLTAALGSNLVNMLYVLDEPTTGLHPRDVERLTAAIGRLRDAGNTLVVVEHDATLIRSADQVIDIGPGAGVEGGRVVFQGSPQQLVEQSQTATGEYLSGRRQVATPTTAGRRAPAGWLRLEGASHHNLQNVSVDFPLGVLCVVTGVSGSGKSSLVTETVYPAVAKELTARELAEHQEKEGRDFSSVPGQETERRPFLLSEVGTYQSLAGLETIDDVQLIDQGPLGRSRRANPATFLNLFGEIRSLLAATAEAKVHNFSARHFSFNSAGGGRCETCRGAGTIAIDMQFLPDVVMTCPDCHGRRFRREVLEVRYRGLTVAEILALTVREAFPFFRGRTRLQKRLKVLKDVGLDYITLGQPADTLSGGEAQRLKLAAFMARAARARTLFIIDEPTTGLHPADLARLVDCLGLLLAGGHSLIVIEHNLDFVRCADYVIDLGPGAGAAGGRVVATGTPEEVTRVPESITGQFLRGL